MTDLPIACSLSPAELQGRQRGLLAELAGAASGRRLTDDGAHLTLSSSQAHLDLLFRVLAAERDCCRFLTFRLTFVPDLGPIEVELTGPKGTREFLESTFGL